jgi:hypothetical protein
MYCGGFMKRLLIFIYLLCVSSLQTTQAQLLFGNTFQRTPSVGYAERVLQGFNMKVWISNQMTLGLQAWDVGSGQEIPYGMAGGLVYPAGSNIEHLFAAGPWLCGIINGVRKVSEGYNGDSADKCFLPNQEHPLRERMWFTSILNTNEPNKRY